MKAVNKPRTMLLFIAAMFLLPLVLAWLMYTGVVEFHPETTRNKGLLVSPTVPFDWQRAKPLQAEESPSATADAVLGHWVVLYPIEGACGSECEQRLSSVRQVHLATGRDRDRIRLVALFLGQPSDRAAEQIEAIYQEFILAVDTSGGLRRVIETAASPASSSGGTYLIDPLGNIMMVYPDTADANDLKVDLKRLLKWSKLDEQS